jgi:capsular polysaccharide biosynthesis protein
MSVPSEIPYPGDEEAAALQGEAPEAYFPGVLVAMDVLKEAVRRRRWLLIALALLGMLAGASFHLVLPSKYTAVTALYLVEPSGTTTSDDATLLQSDAVAERAFAYLPTKADDASYSDYQGEALSDEILEISASASTRAGAVSYARALGKAFFAVRNEQITYQTEVDVAGLASQVSAVQDQIGRLTGSIDALSASGSSPEFANQVAALISARDNDYSQVSQLEAQQQQDLLAETSVVKGSRVLDPAEAAAVSSKRAAAKDGLSGLVAGVALGLGFVLVVAVVSDRPRRRADVALALGVPIELSLGRFHRRRLLRRWRLRRLLAEPPTEFRVLERRLRAHAEAAAGSALLVVAVEAAEPAALGVGSLALSFASEGKQVLVVDMAEGRPLARLLCARGPKGSPLLATFHGRTVTLFMAPDDPTEPADPEVLRDADVVLVLASITPALGAEHLAAWGNGAVVAVTAGKVSTARLAATTQMLNQANLSTRSAILVGADKEDESFGALNPPASPSGHGDSDNYPAASLEAPKTARRG